MNNFPPYIFLWSTAIIGEQHPKSAGGKNAYFLYIYIYIYIYCVQIGGFATVILTAAIGPHPNTQAPLHRMWTRFIYFNIILITPM